MFTCTLFGLVTFSYLGLWGIGLATRNADLNKAPGGGDADSWVLCSDGVLRHSGSEVQKAQQIVQEGDIVVSTI